MTEKAELYFEDGTVVLCTRLTAAYFGVTTATLSNWTRSGCPQLRRGYYDLKAVLDWRTRREERPEMPSDPEQMSAGNCGCTTTLSSNRHSLRPGSSRTGWLRGNTSPVCRWCGTSPDS